MERREELRQLGFEAVIDLLLEAESMIAELRERLDRLEQRQNRRGSGRTGDKKKPGRKAGRGRFERRGAPRPEEVTQHLNVPLKSKDCPACGAPMDVSVEEVSVTDLPPAKPEVKVYHRELGRCPVCGKIVRAFHEDLAHDQCGASAHRLGPGVLALGCALHCDCGLPVRKVPQVLLLGFGLRVTQSALTQSQLKLAQRALPAYEQLRADIAKAAVVHTDDTGWRIGGLRAQLMGFFTSDTAFYQIKERHRHQEVLEVIGESFAGSLVTDRGKSYEAKVLEAIAQQKCLAHIGRNLHEELEHKSGAARRFPLSVLDCLGYALQIYHRQQSAEPLSAQQYAHEVALAKEWLNYLLWPRQLKDKGNQRLLEGLAKQHSRGRILRFLEEPGVPPTNNLAERMLRPAVIARKVSHCSKNGAGATAYAVLKSIAVTCRLRAQSFYETVVELLKSPRPPASAPLTG